MHGIGNYKGYKKIRFQSKIKFLNQQKVNLSMHICNAHLVIYMYNLCSSKYRVCKQKNYLNYIYHLVTFVATINLHINVCYICPAVVAILNFHSSQIWKEPSNE
jgi:hypothetical protein